MCRSYAKVFVLMIAFTLMGTLNAGTLDYLADIPACDSEIYCHGELLAAAQNARIYNDSKTFVDMKLKQQPDVVLEAFKNLTDRSPESMRAFVDEYFDGPGTEFETWRPSDWTESPKFLNKVKDKKLKQFGSHLNQLWKDLGRKIKEDVKTNQDMYSLLYLPKPFIVPGGRFREVYYWDSFWVVNGLLLCEMYDTVRGMIDNFLVMVDRYGFVPNGGRVYYTRRSQPPFLIPIVNEYLNATNDTDFLRNNIATLEKEYQFWIDNRTVDVTRGGQSYRLARYAVDIGQPRPESYREDIETAHGVSDFTALYSDIASSAESGWDFSTRWFVPGNTSLNSSQTRNIIPVDLNAILWLNEKLLSKFFVLLGDDTKAADYHQKARDRQVAIENVLWSDEQGIWLDFDLAKNASNDQFFASNIVPLWAGCYGDDNSTDSRSRIERNVLDYLKKEDVLDYPGGVPTSLTHSGQQWDFPNVWPPLQQMFIWALDSSTLPEARGYARKLAQRGILTTWRSWMETGHMYEKYDATIAGLPGRGGEYEVQLGFGWTNAVAIQVLDKYGDVLTSDEDHVTTAGPLSGSRRSQCFGVTNILLISLFLLPLILL